MDNNGDPLDRSFGKRKVFGIDFVGISQDSHQEVLVLATEAQVDLDDV